MPVSQCQCRVCVGLNQKLYMAEGKKSVIHRSRRYSQTETSFGQDLKTRFSSGSNPSTVVSCLIRCYSFSSACFSIRKPVTEILCIVLDAALCLACITTDPNLMCVCSSMCVLSLNLLSIYCWLVIYLT